MSWPADREALAEIQRLIEVGLVEALRRSKSGVASPILVISLDVYPWHGYIALSLMDESTPERSRFYNADWAYFEIVRSKAFESWELPLEPWERAANLIAQTYEAATDKGEAEAAAVLLHRVAGAALRSSSVAAETDRLGWGGAKFEVINVDDPSRFNYAASEATEDYVCGSPSCQE